jgi:hypothetical protein
MHCCDVNTNRFGAGNTISSATATAEGRRRIETEPPTPSIMKGAKRTATQYQQPIMTDVSMLGAMTTTTTLAVRNGLNGKVNGNMLRLQRGNVADSRLQPDMYAYGGADERGARHGNRRGFVANLNRGSMDHRIVQQKGDAAVAAAAAAETVVPHEMMRALRFRLSQLETVEDINVALADANAHLHSDVKRLRDTAAAATAAAERLSVDNAAACDERATLRREVATLRDAVDAERATKHTLHNELVGRRIAVHKSTVAAAGYESSATALRDSVNTLSERLLEANSEQQVHGEREATLVVALKAARGTALRVDGELTTTRENFRSLTATHDEVSGVLKYLQKQYEGLDAAHKPCGERISKLDLALMAARSATEAADVAYERIEVDYKVIKRQHVSVRECSRDPRKRLPFINVREKCIPHDFCLFLFAIQYHYHRLLWWSARPVQSRSLMLFISLTLHSFLLISLQAAMVEREAAKEQKLRAAATRAREKNQTIATLERKVKVKEMTLRSEKVRVEKCGVKALADATKLNAMKVAAAALETTLATTTAELATTTDGATVLRAQVDKCNVTIGEQQTQVTTATAALRAAKLATKHVSADLVGAKTALKMARDECAALTTDLKTEKVTAGIAVAQAAELTSELKMRATELAELTSRFDEQTTALKRVVLQRNHQRKENLELISRDRALASKLKSITTILSTKSREHDRMVQHSKAAVAAEARVRRELAQLQEARGVLALKLEASKSKVFFFQPFEAQAHALRQECEALRSKAYTDALLNARHGSGGGGGVDGVGVPLVGASVAADTTDGDGNAASGTPDAVAGDNSSGGNSTAVTAAGAHALAKQREAAARAMHAKGVELAALRKHIDVQNNEAHALRVRLEATEDKLFVLSPLETEVETLKLQIADDADYMHVLRDDLKAATAERDQARTSLRGAVVLPDLIKALSADVDGAAAVAAAAASPPQADDPESYFLDTTEADAPVATSPRAADKVAKLETMLFHLQDHIVKLTRDNASLREKSEDEKARDSASEALRKALNIAAQ